MNKFSTLLIATMALTQGASAAVGFDENFECHNQTKVAEKKGFFGFETISTDFWTSNKDEANMTAPKGVSPSATVMGWAGGNVGNPVDEIFEKFLLTGHGRWMNYRTESNVIFPQEGMAGVVFGYQNPGEYYACMVANKVDLNCAGGSVATAGSYVSLIKVSAGWSNLCATTLNAAPFLIQKVAIPAVAGDPLKITVNVTEGGAVSCGVTASYGNLAAINHQQATPVYGLTGFGSWKSSLAGGTRAVFDDIKVTLTPGAHADTKDTDNDGIPDVVEALIGTNPNSVDTDADSIGDTEEVQMQANPVDTDMDGTIDAKDTDSDGDGTPDAMEAGDANLATKAKDTNCDGLADYRDGTYPANDDPDGDGLKTPLEITLGTDPMNPDTDGDGLKDGEEHLTVGTDPLKPDTDADGLKDGKEVNEVLTDPLDADSDDDDLKDGKEVNETMTNPLDPDTDDGSVKDGVEVGRGTDPLDPSDDLPADDDADDDNGGNSGDDDADDEVTGNSALPLVKGSGGGCTAAGGELAWMFLAVVGVALEPRIRKRMRR